MLGSRRVRYRSHKADKLMIQMTILSLLGMWRKFECLVRRKFRQDSGQRSYLSRGSSRQVRQNTPNWLVRLHLTVVFVMDKSCSYWSQLASCTSRTVPSGSSGWRSWATYWTCFTRGGAGRGLTSSSRTKLAALLACLILERASGTRLTPRSPIRCRASRWTCLTSRRPRSAHRTGWTLSTTSTADGRCTGWTRAT